MTDNIREKLVELLHGAQKAWGDYMSEWWTDGERPIKDYWGIFADHLIANNVTVQEWIPVTERLPQHGDIVLCKARYRYDVLQWDGRVNRWVNRFMNPKKEYVTHWMPLPTPPEGE